MDLTNTMEDDDKSTVLLDGYLTKSPPLKLMNRRVCWKQRWFVLVQEGSPNATCSTDGASNAPVDRPNADDIGIQIRNRTRITLKYYADEKKAKQLTKSEKGSIQLVSLSQLRFCAKEQTLWFCLLDYKSDRPFWLEADNRDTKQKWVESIQMAFSKQASSPSSNSLHPHCMCRHRTQSKPKSARTHASLSSPYKSVTGFFSMNLGRELSDDEGEGISNPTATTYQHKMPTATSYQHKMFGQDGFDCLDFESIIEICDNETATESSTAQLTNKLSSFSLDKTPTSRTKPANFHSAECADDDEVDDFVDKDSSNVICSDSYGSILDKQAANEQVDTNHVFCRQIGVDIDENMSFEEQCD